MYTKNILCNSVYQGVDILGNLFFFLSLMNCFEHKISWFSTCLVISTSYVRIQSTTFEICDVRTSYKSFCGYNYLVKYNFFFQFSDVKLRCVSTQPWWNRLWIAWTWEEKGLGFTDKSLWKWKCSHWKRRKILPMVWSNFGFSWLYHPLE